MIATIIVTMMVTIRGLSQRTLRHAHLADKILAKLDIAEVV